MKKYRNIILDFGGVLLDWNPHYLLDDYFGSYEKSEWFIKNICTSEWNSEMDRGKPFAVGVAELSARFPEWSKEIELYHSGWIKMIDDNLANVLGARAVGIDSIQFTDASSLRQILL